MGRYLVCVMDWLSTTTLYNFLPYCAELLPNQAVMHPVGMLSILRCLLELETCQISVAYWASGDVHFLAITSMWLVQDKLLGIFMPRTMKQLTISTLSPLMLIKERCCCLNTILLSSLSPSCTPCHPCLRSGPLQCCHLYICKWSWSRIDLHSHDCIWNVVRGWEHFFAGDRCFIISPRWLWSKDQDAKDLMVEWGVLTLNRRWI